MTRVLVTGSEGFIGSHVASLLRSNGLEVFTMDLVGEGSLHTLMDLRSKELKTFVKQIQPEVIIHLAAQVDVVSSMSNPKDDLEINGLGTLELVQAAGLAGVKKFIFVGSGGAIYDSASPMPVNELANTNPVSPYGLSKLLAEGYVRIFCQEFGIEWVSLALSNCYGDVRHHKRGVIYNFYDCLINDDAPIINGAEVTRDFVHVDDVARAIFLAIGKTPNCRVNISSNSEVTLLELCNLVASVLGKETSPNIRELREGDVLRSRLDNSLAKKLLGWSPEVDLISGLKMSLQGDGNL